MMFEYFKSPTVRKPQKKGLVEPFDSRVITGELLPALPCVQWTQKHVCSVRVAHKNYMT
jgi:hypothetical protein